MQTTLQILYKTFYGNKKKERFETILEPLQALVQIAFLSYYPIGSKLTIKNNILYIQAPCYSQSVTRWYNNDTQEDLFYLFNIFYRFKKFYVDVKIEHAKLFELLISLAKTGINNLIRTYNQTDKNHVLHTLHMYKNMLDGTSSHHSNGVINLHVSNNNYETSQITNTLLSSSSHDENNNKINKHGMHDKKNKMAMDKIAMVNNNVYDNIHSEQQRQNEKKSTNVELATSAPHTSSEVDIDSIFIKISVLYSDDILRIIYNTLIEMERDDTNYLDYANGLNMMLQPTNIRIKKWIDENILF
jgi:hypothetical protein